MKDGQEARHSKIHESDLSRRCSERDAMSVGGDASHASRFSEGNDELDALLSRVEGGDRIVVSYKARRVLWAPCAAATGTPVSMLDRVDRKQKVRVVKYEVRVERDCHELGERI